MSTSPAAMTYSSSLAEFSSKTRSPTPKRFSVHSAATRVELLGREFEEDVGLLQGSADWASVAGSAWSGGV